jgi:hypothetical protein
MIVISGEENRPFIFMRRKIELIPLHVESHLILGYDVEDNVNCLFLVRRCTEAEKKMARENLSDTMATANSHVETVGTTHSASSFLGETNKSDATPYQRNSNSYGTPNCSQPSWKSRFRTTTGISPMLMRLHEHSQAESATSRLLTNLCKYLL